RQAAEPTGEECPECGKPLVVRQGKRGAFVGCSGYPSCKFVKNIDPPEGAQEDDKDLGECPDCGKPLARKNGRRGSFVGCTGYPDCKYIKPGTARAVAPEP